MLGIFKEYRRKKILAQLAERPVRKGVLPNFEAVGNITFLYALSCPGDVETLNQIDAYLEGAGIGFRGIVVELKSSFANDSLRKEFKENLQGRNIVFMSKNDLNWIGMPEDASFMEQESPLFISLVREPSFTMNYLTLKANSSCIVGMYNNPKLPYTFVLEPLKTDKGEFSHTAYLESLFNYFKAFNRSVSNE